MQLLKKIRALGEKGGNEVMGCQGVLNDGCGEPNISKQSYVYI